MSSSTKTLKKNFSSLMWWFMPIILGLRRPAMRIALSCLDYRDLISNNKERKKESKKRRKGKRKKVGKTGLC